MFPVKLAVQPRKRRNNMSNFNKEAFMRDLSYSNNKEEAVKLVPQVLHALYLASSPVSLQELYIGLNCGDIHLYLCLHALIQKGYIVGTPPYQYGMKSHDNMVYSIKENN
jgi:hypothetical protein